MTTRVQLRVQRRSCDIVADISMGHGWLPCGRGWCLADPDGMPTHAELVEWVRYVLQCWVTVR